MSENIYEVRGTSITWPVPAHCSHNERAFDDVAEWCETCGQVLSGGLRVSVHTSALTVCSLGLAPGTVCGHGESVVARDARDWVGAAVR